MATVPLPAVAAPTAVPVDATSTAPPSAAPEHDAAAVGPQPVDVAPKHYPTLVFDVSGLDDATFAAELRLRLPERTIIPVEAPRPKDEFAYVSVSVASGRLHVLLVEADGSGYERTVAREEDQEVRVASSMVAVLLSSVESGTAQPDRDDAVIPEGEAEPPKEPATDEGPATKPDPLEIVPEHPANTPPSLELGVAALGGLGLGIAPTTDAGAFGGAGGGLLLDLATRRGVYGRVSARVHHRRQQDVGATRAQLGLGGGYRFRWPRGELLVGGLVTLEPWWLTRSAGATDLTIAGDDARRLPLLGLMATLDGGWRFAPARWRGYGLRIGPTLRLGGSLIPERGGRTARIDLVRDDGSSTAVARLGGVELELGLSVVLWIPVRR